MVCYGLDRFSEDIDLDSQRAKVPAVRFFKAIDQACRSNGYSWREGKNTPTVQRAFVDYGDSSRPLKIEVSHRKREIEESKISVVNGIRAYTISEMCKLKCAAYMSRDKIRDLFDVSFIADRYYDQLAPDTRDMLAMALEYKDLDQFDYLLRTQADPLIDSKQLEDRFLRTMDKAGLLTDQSMNSEPLVVLPTKMGKDEFMDRLEEKRDALAQDAGNPTHPTPARRAGR